jgi:hypothetical protein
LAGTLALIASAGLFGSPRAHAERALLAPQSDAPARVVAGGTLSATVDVATGLTPPPGIQEDRALRLFAITLCADGIDLGAGARRCFPLAVRNVRPVDGSSLRYRVEAPVPVWVAPWVYDLTLRFPGGEVAAPRAVIVSLASGSEPEAGYEPAPVFARSERGVTLSKGSAGAASRVRVHVGAGGFALAGGSFRAFPLPDVAHGFAPGFVALVLRQGSEPVSMTKRQGERAFPLLFSAGRAEAGRPTRLRAAGFPPGTTVFWWLDPARGALGSDVTTVFLLRGQAPLELLAVAPDGRVARRQALLPIWQRRAFGCSLTGLGPAPLRAESTVNWFILLAIALSCVRRCRGGARFAIAAPRAQRPKRLLSEAGRARRRKKGLGGRG